MSRVNTEECWWSDPRRTRLAFTVGSQALADGIALNAWRLGQEFWKRDRQLVPKHLFEALEGADSLLKINLAEVREDLVYIRGSSAYLDWINESKETGRVGGRISAQRPRDKKGRLLSKDLQGSSKGALDKTPRGSKGIQPSVSSSSSNTNTVVPQKTETTLLWEHYKTELQNQRQVQAYKSAKTNTICKKLIQDLGLEKAKALVLEFLKDKDQWVIDQAYPIGLLLSQLQKYSARLAMATPIEQFHFTDSTEVANV